MERETVRQAFRFVLLTAGVGAGAGVVIGIAPDLGPIVVLGPLGLLLAFKGWAVHEGFVKLFGFLIGFGVGAGGTVLMMMGASGTGGSFEAALLMVLLAGVGVGAVSAILALAYERLFVSVTGMLVAMGVPYLYSVIAGSVLFAYLSLPLGIVGAYVAWKSYKGMVILMTAVLGGGLAAAGLSLINGGLGIGSFVIVTLVGAFYQLSGASVDGAGVGQAAGVRVQRSITSVLREFWASIVFLLLLLISLVNYVPGVRSRIIPFSLLLAGFVVGPLLFSTVNTVRGGSLRSIIVFSLVPGVYAVINGVAQYYSWQMTASNPATLSDFIYPRMILLFGGIGLGAAVVGVLLGTGYNRFVGSVSGGAPADSDAV